MIREALVANRLPRRFEQRDAAHDHREHADDRPPRDLAIAPPTHERADRRDRDDRRAGVLVRHAGREPEDEHDRNPPPAAGVRRFVGEAIRDEEHQIHDEPEQVVAGVRAVEQHQPELRRGDRRDRDDHEEQQRVVAASPRWPTTEHECGEQVEHAELDDRRHDLVPRPGREHQQRQHLAEPRVVVDVRALREVVERVQRQADVLVKQEVAPAIALDRLPMRAQDHHDPDRDDDRCPDRSRALHPPCLAAAITKHSFG